MKTELFITVVIFIIPNLLLVGWLMKDLFTKTPLFHGIVGTEFVSIIEVKRNILNLIYRERVSEYMMVEMKRSGIDLLEHVEFNAARSFSQQIIENGLMSFKEIDLPSHMLDRDKEYEFRLDVLEPMQQPFENMNLPSHHS